MSWIRQVWKDDILLVDSDQGIQVLTSDLFGEKPPFLKADEETAFDPENKYHVALLDSIKDYLETYNEPYSFEFKKNVWVGQYTMPGYMDQSPLNWSTNKKELIKNLNEYYGPQRQ